MISLLKVVPQPEAAKRRGYEERSIPEPVRLGEQRPRFVALPFGFGG